MSKVKGQEAFRKEIYGKMTETGYVQPYETFIARNSDPNSDKVEDLLIALRRKGVYDGNLEDFKAQFYGVKKKETPSETSSSGSGSDYVGTANVVADGSTLEKKLSSFNIVREGQEFSQGKKETTLAQIRQMKTERPDQTIVQVKDDKGKPTLRYLDEHKSIIKKKANRVPDAATLEAKPVDEAVLDYYSNKKDYVDMVEERRARGFATTFNEGKFIAEGINEMQRDVRNAIDLKVKEIGKPVLDQYLNLNEALKKTPQDSPEYGKMMADYQKFQQAHPDLQEYEELTNRFWALDAKNKEARNNPNYKGYYDVQAKKEQAQINADLMDAKAKQGIGKYLDFNAAPAATKELFDLGTGVVRAAAGIERFITGKKYASLDFAVEAMEAVIDPALNSFTATPSNRTKLVGQQYAEVGDYKVLLEGDKVMGVVSKQGGYQLRNQEKAQEIVAQYERDKPKIKTQALNPFTATDVIVGGAIQLATGMGAASVGAKLGQAGSIVSSVGSKTASIAANSASTYNKLYNAAIQELGPSNQKAAERYAALSSLAMSTLGTLINPLEQQLLNVGGRQAIKTLAKELGEGVAEQTAVRSAVRSLMTFAKTAFKEGAVEGAAEAVVDDAIKYAVNKTMLGEDKMEINLSQDLLDNVAEETIGGLFGSVQASLNPSTFQVESLENAYKSPNRTKVLSKLDKDAKKHYEKVFAQADLNPGKSLLRIHQEELIKAKTGEEFVAPPVTTDQAADTQPPISGSDTATQPPISDTEATSQPLNTALNLAATLDPQQGDKITTPMGQSGTIVGFDIDEEDETPRYYKVKMDESGEETLISIADYNKNIYERGIQDLQSQGMSRNEAEFAVEAARSVKDISYQASQVQADATTTEDNLSTDVGQMVDQLPDVGNMIKENAEPGPDDRIVEDAPEPVDQVQTDQPMSEPEPISIPTTQPISEPVQSKTIDGLTYNRQTLTQGVTGSTGKIEFSASAPMQEFTYKVIEADELQPSHSNSGGRNPLHFIPEAQPKERNDKAGIAASDAIAENIDLGRVSVAPNAYTGAPIVNERGEVIQGNNRAIGIKKHYQGGKAEYKQQLISQAQQLGIDPTQIQGMKNPVLVREVKVDDATAIELGNYDVKDLETGGQRRIDPVAASRRIPFAEKQKIASALLVNPDKTLRENIKDNFARVAKMLVPKFISPSQYDTIVSNKTNNITPKGVDDITELVLHFLFDGGDIKLRQVFDMLPAALQQGIINSMPQLFSVPQSESIVEQLQNAMILLYEVDAAKSATIDEFLGQIDMFDAAKANRFSPSDIALAKLLIGKKQKEIQTLFSKYASLTLGTTDMFGSTPGVSKAQALSELTRTPYKPTAQDVTNGANQNIQRNASGKDSGSGRGTGPDARISDEGIPGQTTPNYQGGVQFTDVKSTPGRLKPLAKVVERALKAMKKYGEFKVYFYEDQGDIRQSYNERANFALNDRQSVTGFFNPDDNSIHVYVNADGASTIALHEILHPFVRALKKGNPALFTKLYENLQTIPEYSAVTMTGNSVKGFSENPYYDFIGTKEEEALVEFFAKVGSGELILREKSKGKVVEWINSILRAIGFDEISDKADIRKWANAIATALQQGIELDRVDSETNEGVQARIDVIQDFPYYDKVTKLVENGINKGLTKNQIVQTILSAYNSQNISVPQSLVEAIYTSRTAIRKKGRKPVGKLRTAFSNFHQKYFVANGGGEIREMVERLEGTIQRHVDQANELIKLAEKQSKGIDQELVDRYLRDENSLAEKQEIVATILRPNNVSEELIEKYLRGGTTRYQRLEAVKELDPNVDWGPFVESRMNDQDKALIPVDLAATLSTMRQSLDNLSSYLVDEGYVVGDRTEVILENLGQYMSDVYGIFKDKKFKPTEAAKVKAKKYFMDQIRKDKNKLAALSATGNDLEEEIFKEAERMVNDYITKSKQPKGQGQGAPVAKKSESIFKQKEGVPDELKELLGKYGPLQEYAYSLFNLVNYVEKSKFQRRMVDLGKGVFMWDRNDPARPADANYELKGFASDKLKGDTNPFKGMMTDQATFEVLAGLDKLFFEGGPILEKFLKFQGFVNKSKTVYSYQTHFGNILGNFFFMAFNGMVDASTAASFKMAVNASGRDLFAGKALFGRYGLENDEVDEVLTILKNEQVIGQDVSLMAIRETVGDLEKTKTPSPNPFLRGLQKTRDAAVGFDKGLTNVYQAEDNFFKILAYMTERKRYGDSLYGKPYDKLDSIQKEEVNRIATEIAKANWPNYGRMGKFSQMAAKNNVLFGNFLSFTFEAIRTYGNTWAQATRELKSDNPGVRFIGQKRRAGLLIGSLAADAALMTMAKTANGVFALLFAGDDKTKMNRDLRLGVPKFIQGGDLMFTDKGNGKYSVIDISAKNPLGVFRRHFNSAFFAPTDQEIAAAVSKQFLESFLSQSIAMKYVDAIRKNEDDNGNPLYLETDTGPEAAGKIFAYTLKAIGPAAVNSALKVGKSDDPLVTLGIQISGHNVYEIDFSSTWGKLIGDYSDNIRKLRAQLKKTANKEDITDSEYQVALMKFNQKREKELKRLQKLKQSMLNVGLPKDVILEEMKTLNDDDELFINTGKLKKLSIKRKELLYD